MQLGCKGLPYHMAVKIGYVTEFAQLTERRCKGLHQNHVITVAGKEGAVNLMDFMPFRNQVIKPLYLREDGDFPDAVKVKSRIYGFSSFSIIECRYTGRVLL